MYIHIIILDMYMYVYIYTPTNQLNPHIYAICQTICQIGDRSMAASGDCMPAGDPPRPPSHKSSPF